MRIGKLTNEQLQGLVLSRLPQLSSNTLQGASIGADCAWLKTGDTMTVTSSDPITAGGMQAGTLAIHVSCNDIAACGIRPTGILIVIIAPPFAEEKDIVTIVDQASEEAKKVGVDIVGGHTEVSDAVNTFVVISTAFGVVPQGHPVPAGVARPGDSLLMTKTAGIEGSYIAATEHSDLLEGKIDETYLTEAREYNKLISVVNAGACAGAIKRVPEELNSMGSPLSVVSLMHDVTEGGVFGAAYEMAHFSGCGILLDKAKVPVTDATAAICSCLDLDPMRLISSGSLLIATGYPQLVIEEFIRQNIRVAQIGRFTEAAEGMLYSDSDGSIRELPPPGTDEIYKL